MKKIFKSRIIKSLIIIVEVVFLDRITKSIVSQRLIPNKSLSIIGNFFKVTLVFNPGGVFGTRIGGNLFYILAAIFAALILVVWFLKKKTSVAHITAISLMLGGAIGNLIDRIRIGKVIDFLDFGIGNYRWYTFNIADSAITVGITIIIFAELFLSHHDNKKDRQEIFNETKYLEKIDKIE